MLTIGVDPVAFTIGSLEIRWYGILIALAVIALLLVMLREAKRRGLTDDVYSIFLTGIAGGLVGGRLAYIVSYWDYFVAHPREIIGFQGLSQPGMIIGVVVAALIYMAVRRMRFSSLLSMGDVLAVGAPLGLAIARIGCTLNGCCSGQPSPFDFFPLAVIYTPRDAMDPQYWNVPLYFTQFYHLLWGFIVFGIVWQLRSRLKPEGSLFFFFLCIFAAGDFVIRFLRTEGSWIWGLQQAQVLDLGILAVFLPWLIIKLRRFHKQASVAELATQPAPQQSQGD
jgi:phosphatidylglycerol:prolipoprotein diacylglycerol transferase